MAAQLRTAVVGVGHLGKEHARILAQMPDVDLVGVVDPRAVQAAAVAQRCGTRPYSDHRALLGAVDAVVVAAPTAHHPAVARDFLERGVATLVEKPLTAAPADADALVTLAARRGAVLQVGHVERFNPAFEELQRRPLRPKFISCERHGGFSGRSTDVGAVLDLMIHDLDLVLALVRSAVRSVDALGVAVLGGHEDIAQARVTFADGCVAQLAVSRVSPMPVRRMQVWGPEGVAAVDFAKRRLTLAQPNRAALSGVDLRRLDAAGLESIKTELYGHYLQTCDVACDASADQLTRELEEFVRCARTGSKPRVDGAAGRDAVALAGRVLDSLRRHAWTADASGPSGPANLPAPLGTLFATAESQAA